MKILIIALVTLFTSGTANAQFTSATLQASGLTCAMCTKAINNSLAELPFIQSVKADISSSSFQVVFRKNSVVNIDKLKTAVEEAGFSVSKLKLAGTFNDVVVKNDKHVEINGATFHFINVTSQTLNGTREIIMVDKNFIGTKDFKKFSAATKMACIHTGKAEACCRKDGVKAERIYHVTI